MLTQGFGKVTNACRSRLQAVERVGGLRFVALWAPLANVLRSTTWGSRAWNLQEYVLSKQALILAKERAYYRCALEGTSEDTCMVKTTQGTLGPIPRILRRTYEHPSWSLDQHI
jgi:hypothetical protein